MREDVILLFQEMEEARTSLEQLQRIIGTVSEPNVKIGKLNLVLM